jgi:transmembrane sensor
MGRAAGIEFKRMARRSERDTLEIDAQAAAWAARLGYEGRDPVDEAAFRTWLAEDARHHMAFDEARTTWRLGSTLTRTRLPGLDQQRGHLQSWDRRTAIGAGLAAAASVAGAAVWAAQQGEQHFATDVGEQRRIALADGSLMLLDSNTTVKVRLTRARRAVTLLRGRAHFDVAKDLARPFVVTASERQVIAVGTAFDVTRADDAVTVVLVEGRVAIQPLYRRSGVAPATLAPGDRMVLRADGAVRSDRPDMAALTAWQLGRLVFDHESLASAVAQMNRYSRRRLVIGDRALGELMVSGVYTVGDIEAFAATAAQMLPIQIRSDATRLLLVAAQGPSRSNSP